MKALSHYAIAALLVVAVLGAVLWPFLDGYGRAGYLAAVAITVPIQLALFSLVVRALDEQNRFLLRWAGGILVRMGVVATVGLLLPRLQGLNGTVLLMSVCGLFFALLVLEPAFFRTKVTARFAQ